MTAPVPPPPQKAWDLVLSQIYKFVYVLEINGTGFG